jgi:pantothenate synthetase
MSSRNVYLSLREREQALSLYRALKAAERLYEGGERKAEKYLRAMRAEIDRAPDAVPDYISLVHPDTLENLEQVDDSALAALARDGEVKNDVVLEAMRKYGIDRNKTNPVLS